MKDTLFIVVQKNGVHRMTKRSPYLDRGEIAVKLVVTIPDECFRSPTLTATLDIPEDAVIQSRVEVEAVPQAEPV